MLRENSKANMIILSIIFCFSYVNLNGQNLEAHRWKHRILIIKTSDKNAKPYKKQLEALESLNNGLEERKLVIYKVNRDKFEMEDYTDTTLSQNGTLSQAFAKEIFSNKDDFEVILIGLDGDIKLRQNQILVKNDLFAIIDAMPMRRAEIRND